MAQYTAPVEDFLFVLHDVLAVQDSGIAELEEFTPDVTRAILEGAGEFAQNVLFPLNQTGDEEGAHLVDGQVRTPKGFPDAYRRYCDDGWNRLAIAESVGGMGLPAPVANCIFEMFAASNAAFAMYSGFNTPASHLFARFGPAWVSKHVVPHVVSGNWTVTMALTEPDCGTDLRLLKTRAVRQADGSFRVSGTKIFISGGDHDLGENVVHLLLAKLPDADGNYVDDFSTVNLFLVSKRALDTDTGELGSAGAVRVAGIEKKMGLKANATCMLSFEDAVAWPMSPRGDDSGRDPGMAGMFFMMNHARLGTGLQALAMAVAPYQSAAEYARQRLAGRAPGGRINHNHAADPLIGQPDVRRLLLESASFIEGGRAAAAWAGYLQMVAKSDAKSAAERQEAEELLLLVSPVFKAFFSDRSFESINASLQIFGGHGYIRDYGIEQYVRDERVSQIYEGANGVQAFDLAQRRLRMNDGRVGRTFVAMTDRFIAEHRESADMAPFVTGLGTAMTAVQDSLDWLQTREGTDVEKVAGLAYDVMVPFGIAIVAYAWARVAHTALEMLAAGSGDEAFLRRKLVLAQVWMDREVPLGIARTQRIRNGAATFGVLAAEQF